MGFRVACNAGDENLQVDSACIMVAQLKRHSAPSCPLQTPTKQCFRPPFTLLRAFSQPVPVAPALLPCDCVIVCVCLLTQWIKQPRG